MATLDISRNYDQGEILLEADLDAIQDGLETFFNTTKINDDNLQDNSIDGSTKFIADSVVTALFASGTIEAAKINDLAVTTAKIADSAVTTAKIAALNITTAKILDDNVTTAKIAANAVTAAKLTDGSEFSSASGTVSHDATAAVGSDITITNASVSVTTTGRPVMLTLVSSSVDDTSPSSIKLASVYSSGSLYPDHQMTLKLYKDAVLTYTWTLNIALFTGLAAQIDAASLPPGAFTYIDSPAAGTYTYELKMNYAEAFSSGYSSATLVAKDVKLVAVEL